MEDLAEKNKIELSDVVRQVIRLGLESQKLSGDLEKLRTEGDLVLSSKRALEVRRAMSHFGGHESGWRTTGAKLEDEDCRQAYTAISEDVQSKAKDYAKKYMESKKSSENQDEQKTDVSEVKEPEGIEEPKPKLGKTLEEWRRTHVREPEDKPDIIFKKAAPKNEPTIGEKAGIAYSGRVRTPFHSKKPRWA